jgi:hypothetical protein
MTPMASVQSLGAAERNLQPDEGIAPNRQGHVVSENAYATR